MPPDQPRSIRRGRPVDPARTVVVRKHEDVKRLAPARLAELSRSLYRSSLWTSRERQHETVPRRGVCPGPKIKADAEGPTLGDVSRLVWRLAPVSVFS